MNQIENSFYPNPTLEVARISFEDIFGRFFSSYFKNLFNIINNKLIKYFSLSSPFWGLFTYESNVFQQPIGISIMDISLRTFSTLELPTM